MQVFTRSKGELAKGVLYSLGGALVGFVVAGVAGWPLAGLIGLPLVCFLAVGWLLVLGEDIRVELHADGRLDFYRMGKLKNSLDLNRCGIRASSRQKKAPVVGMADRSICFIDPETGKATRLDFAPLGKGSFTQLKQALQEYAD